MATLVQKKIGSKIKVGAKKTFAVKEPNEETLAACRRVDAGIGLKKISFEEFKQMLRK
jgi:hypothetical protein